MRWLLLLASGVVALVAATGAEAWSWPADGPVLRPFVFGSDPYLGGQHRGIDVGGGTGSAVRAPVAGTVTFAGAIPRGGTTLAIRTLDGLYSVTLVHLGSLGVSRGDSVSEGETVGTIGPSGEPDVAEPYVYLGVRLADQRQGYLDPMTFLPARATAAPPQDAGSAAPAPAGAPAPANDPPAVPAAGDDPAASTPAAPEEADDPTAASAAPPTEGAESDPASPGANEDSGTPPPADHPQAGQPEAQPATTAAEVQLPAAAAPPPAAPAPPSDPAPAPSTAPETGVTQAEVPSTPPVSAEDAGTPSPPSAPGAVAQAGPSGGRPAAEEPAAVEPAAVEAPSSSIIAPALPARPLARSVPSPAAAPARRPEGPRANARPQTLRAMSAPKPVQAPPRVNRPAAPSAPGKLTPVLRVSRVPAAAERSQGGAPAVALAQPVRRVSPPVVLTQRDGALAAAATATQTRLRHEAPARAAGPRSPAQATKRAGSPGASVAPRRGFPAARVGGAVAVLALAFIALRWRGRRPPAPAGAENEPRMMGPDAAQQLSLATDPDRSRMALCERATAHRARRGLRRPCRRPRQVLPAPWEPCPHGQRHGRARDAGHGRGRRRRGVAA